MFQSLTNARRQLALFQHHDGVTGTAKSLVMDDYGRRMNEAMQICQAIIGKGAEFLLTGTLPAANSAFRVVSL